jgi:hypothetical protein
MIYSDDQIDIFGLLKIISGEGGEKRQYCYLEDSKTET